MSGSVALSPKISNIFYFLRTLNLSYLNSWLPAEYCFITMPEETVLNMPEDANANVGPDPEPLAKNARKSEFLLKAVEVGEITKCEDTVGKLCGVNLAIVAFGLVNAVSIFFIVIGFMNLNDCNVSPLLGTNLVLLGFSQIASRVIANGQKLWTVGLTRIVLKIFKFLIDIFNSVLWACLWMSVYRIYEDVSYERSDMYHYCNKILYLTALSTTVISLSIHFAVLIFLLLVILFIACWFGSAPDYGFQFYKALAIKTKRLCSPRD